MGRRLRIAQTGAYCVAFVALGLVTASLGPTLSGLADRTGTLLSGISIVFTARSLGYLIGSFLSGRLYDRVPGHPVMAGMLIAMGGTMALIPVVPWLWLLAPVFLLTGAAEGAVDVGGNALLVWVHGSEVGPYMNALHFFFGLGAFLSPVLIALVLQRGGDLAWAYWVVALLMLPPVAWLASMPSPARQAEDHGTAKEGGSAVLLALLGAFFFLYVGAEVGFGGWIHTYSVTLGMADQTAAAYLTSAFWGALTAGRLLAIPIAAYLRPRAILLIDLLICLVGVVAILAWTGSQVVLWIGTLGLGLGMASIFPTLMSFAERRVAVTGQVAGWFLVSGSAGGMSLPWLIGQLFEGVGPRVTLVAIGASLALAVVIWAALTRRARVH